MPSTIKLCLSECPLPQAPKSAGWESESSLDRVLMGIDAIFDCVFPLNWEILRERSPAFLKFPGTSVRHETK